MAETQPCPYCSEEIKVGARKCRWCHEYLDDPDDDEVAEPEPRPKKRPKKGKSGAARGADDQEVFWRGNPSAWGYILWYVAVLVLLVLAVVLGKTVSGYFTVILGLLGLIVLGYTELDRRSRVYTLTASRVEARSGILSRRATEVKVRDIRAINLHQGIVDRILGLGRIEISSAGTDEVEVVFSRVPRAPKVREIIREAQQNE